MSKNRRISHSVFPLQFLEIPRNRFPLQFLSFSAEDPWSEGMWAALAEKLPPAVESDAEEVRYEDWAVGSGQLAGSTPKVASHADPKWSGLPGSHVGSVCGGGGV